MTRRYHHARNQKPDYSLQARRLESQGPPTIDDLAGPCNPNYDRALAEYEVVRRHFPELLLPRPRTDGRALDKQTAQFLADALAKVIPAPLARQRGSRYDRK